MIFIIITLILCIMLFIRTLIKDKFLHINIKINNIEEKLNSTLLKRKTLLLDSEVIIKEVLNTNKQIYEKIDELNSSKVSMFELDRRLLVYLSEFYLIKEKYKKLKNNEEFDKIAYALNETEDLLNAYKEYYNDTIEKYNKLITTFPINIAAFLKRKKEKEFFDKKN